MLSRHTLRVCDILLMASYWAIWLATAENTLFALPPIRRTVPITITSITASITAYSAMSCPSSLRPKSLARSVILDSFELYVRISTRERGWNQSLLCALVSQIRDGSGKHFFTLFPCGDSLGEMAAFSTVRWVLSRMIALESLNAACQSGSRRRACASAQEGGTSPASTFHLSRTSRQPVR